MLGEEETNQTNATGEKVEDSTPDYLAAINELKKNSVSRSDYEKLRAENKKLIDSVVNGQQEQVQAQQAVVHTQEEIQQLRNELFNPEIEHTNLAYVQKALELRQAIIENGGVDPFIPIGKQISPTTEDCEIAEKCAKVYQECIDYAEGNSELFTQELMRRTNNVQVRRK